LARVRGALRTVVAQRSHGGSDPSEAGHDEQPNGATRLGLMHEQQVKIKALPRRDGGESWLGVGGDILAIDVFLMMARDPDIQRIERD
jgi:hypothetical protein